MTRAISFALVAATLAACLGPSTLEQEQQAAYVLDDAGLPPEPDPSGGGRPGGGGDPLPPPTDNESIEITTPTLLVHPGLVVWQGFSQRWTYNHRVNHLADFVTDQFCIPPILGRLPECRARLGHAAAAGTGTDTAAFGNHYQRVFDTSARFSSGRVEFVVHANERRAHNTQVFVHAPLPAPLRGHERYVVLLNGFDLKATSPSDGVPGESDTIVDADKLERMVLGVSDAVFDATRNELRFHIDLSLEANCQSLECDGESLAEALLKDGVFQLSPLGLAVDGMGIVNDHPFRTDEEAHYRVAVDFALVAGNTTELNVSQNDGTIQYAWDEYVEPDSPDRDVAGVDQGVAGDVYPEAFLGVQRIWLDLDRDHHYLQWDQYLAPDVYDPSTGQMHYRRVQFLKQWERGMKLEQLFKSLGALREQGNAVMRLDTRLVQLGQGRTSAPHVFSGTIFAEANGGGSDPNAVSERFLRFNPVTGAPL